MENSIFFFCQTLSMISPLIYLLTGPGLLSKQTSPEHNLKNAEHLAFSNCCAAVDCCFIRNSSLVLYRLFVDHTTWWAYEIMLLLLWSWQEGVFMKKLKPSETPVYLKEEVSDGDKIAFTPWLFRVPRPAMQSTGVSIVSLTADK